MSSVGRATVLELLEFDEIRNMLVRHAESPLGREHAKSLEPAWNYRDCLIRLEETQEAWLALQQIEPPSLDGIWQVEPDIRRAKKSGVLDGVTLRRFARLMETAVKIKRYALKLDEDRCSRIRERVSVLADLSPLVQLIVSSVGASGEVLDSASPKLAAVRRSLSEEQNRLRDLLEKIARDPNIQPYLQEPIVTIRHDRYVLPVRQEMRDQIPGVVHDQSASGATVFVEPLRVIERQNNIRQLQREQEEEERRILAQLSARLADHAEALVQMAQILGRLDFQFAKARLARAIQANRPRMVERGSMRLYGARHPLLGSQAVPLDVDLQDKRVLIITGPNTGGKTVTLKTVGLLSLMAQAGLFIPAEKQSVLPVFRRIHADLGDEQSIRQNLSTFSSHMTRIVRMIHQLDANDLVLLDELGAGTDPEEGASLAAAILLYLEQKQVTTLVTTHFSELKSLAAENPNMLNASMEFDENTLQPTYRLRVGLPGNSNAFAVARRLGLPDVILEQAKSRMRLESRQTAALVDQLRLREQELNRELNRVAQERQELLRLIQQQEKFQRRLAEREQEVLEEARGRAKRILDEVKQLKREQERRLSDHAAQNIDLSDWKRRIDQDLQPSQTVQQAPQKEIPARPSGWKPQPGEQVRVVHLGQEGEVLEAVREGEEYIVQLGAMRIAVPREKLVPAHGQKKAAARKQTSVETSAHARLRRERSQNFSPEVHLRMLTVAEGMEKLEKFLDDALLAGADQVRIVHGKGTGAMRQAVHERLRTLPFVVSYRLGGPGEGDLGVTIATLKK